MAPSERACMVSLTTMACLLKLPTNSIRRLRPTLVALLRLHSTSALVDLANMAVQRLELLRTIVQLQVLADSVVFPTRSDANKVTLVRVPMPNSKVVSQEPARTP